MATNIGHLNLPVRTLKKVRRQFLYKDPEEQPTSDIIPSVHYVLNEKITNSKDSLNHPEQNKKMGFAPENITVYFNITNIVIENWLDSRVVTLNLSRNESTSTGHWVEHAARKLESYGDLESALWAKRLRQRVADHRKSMSDYYNMVKSDDPLVQASLSKIKRKAMLKCREVEANYSFQKFMLHLKKDASNLLSISFSEDFLEEIGHTPESFVIWSKEHGVPKTFETKDKVFQSIMKDYMAYNPVIECPIKEGEDLETIALDTEGNPKITQAKFIGIFEPSPQASFSHMYFAVKKNNTIKKTNLQKIENIDESGVKKRLEDLGDIVKDQTTQVNE